MRVRAPNSVTAALALSLALAMAPVSSLGAWGPGDGAPGVTTPSAPLPAWQARTLVPTPATSSGDATAPIRLGSGGAGRSFAAAARAPHVAGRTAPSYLSTWGRLLLDGG